MSFLRLFPEAASTHAPAVDLLYGFLVGVTVVFGGLIAACIVYFCVRYRPGSDADRSDPPHANNLLEAAWVAVPLAVVLVIFFWSSALFFRMRVPPPDALDMYVVGKQWMWKIQHADGRREIDELHVPVGRAVRLTMTSQDVIHSFFVPAFRAKQDALPGRYTSLWFQATRPGTYHLFCAEYCGTAHSRMRGRVIAMAPAEYERWLAASPGRTDAAQEGERLLEQLGCRACHDRTGKGRGPALEGLFGRPRVLQDGRTVAADEAYIRESIVEPGAKLVQGYARTMPAYRGLLSEEQILDLIRTLKTLEEDR